MNLSRSVSSQDGSGCIFKFGFQVRCRGLWCLPQSSLAECRNGSQGTRQEHGVALLLIMFFFSFPRREAKTRSSIKTIFSSPQTRTYWGEERSSWADDRGPHLSGNPTRTSSCSVTGPGRSGRSCPRGCRCRRRVQQTPASG